MSGFKQCVIETVSVGTAELHPVAVKVNVKVTLPGPTAVTKPPFVTEAAAGLLLTHVPPEEGSSVVVPPTHTAVGPVIVGVGDAATVTGEVASETHSVLLSVKTKVALPGLTPVTTPSLATVATAGLLLTHVPPVVGDKVVSPPTQINAGPETATVGFGWTITGAEGSDLQPAASVNLNVACPAPTAVTTPALVMVATAALLVSQVPPATGNIFVVSPIHNSSSPVMDTAGPCVTVTTFEVSEEQPVDVCVNTNLAVPAAKPVTTPTFVIVAIVGFVLTQVPPVVGDRFVVLPTQIELGPFITKIGLGLTVICCELSETQPFVDVNLKVATPSATPVTTPVVELIVAIEGWFADQVPDSEEVKVVVEPIQIFAPLTVIVGLGSTATLIIGSEGQPADDVNVNIAVPCATPVITPALVILATDGWLDAQTPPVVGVTVVVPPIQIGLGPVKTTVGLGLMVTLIGVDAQPVLVSVQVNCTVPAATPVTKPAFVIVAMFVFEDDQTPPAVGVTVVVLPIQMLLGPVNDVFGF